jgi:hypothetical protein
MKRATALLGAVMVLAIFSVGCTGWQGFVPVVTDVKELDSGRSYWFSYTADRRSGFMAPRKDGQNIYMCAEPSPDVGLQYTSKALAELSASMQKINTTGAAKLDAELSTQILALAGRTQTILFLREAMYRLCEQQLNGTLDKEDVKKLYGDILKTSVDLAKAQLPEPSQPKESDTQGKPVVSQRVPR